MCALRKSVQPDVEMTCKDVRRKKKFHGMRHADNFLNA
jgi:hypothetical protein